MKIQRKDIRSSHVLPRAYSSSETESVGLEFISNFSVIVEPSLRIKLLGIGEVRWIASDGPNIADNTSTLWNEISSLKRPDR